MATPEYSTARTIEGARLAIPCNPFAVSYILSLCISHSAHMGLSHFTPVGPTPQPGRRPHQSHLPSSFHLRLSLTRRGTTSVKMGIGGRYFATSWAVRPTGTEQGHASCAMLRKCEKNREPMLTSTPCHLSSSLKNQKVVQRGGSIAGTVHRVVHP